jgi:hypothetical protein
VFGTVKLTTKISDTVTYNKTHGKEQPHGIEPRHVSFLTTIDGAVTAARLCRVFSNRHTEKKLGPRPLNFSAGANSSRLKFRGGMNFPRFLFRVHG